MIESFKNGEYCALAQFYRNGKRHKDIPATIVRPLRRKLDILHAASSEKSLRSPPGNHYERLLGNLSSWSSIRVNIQWRLLFRWQDGAAFDVYLDPHSYRG